MEQEVNVPTPGEGRLVSWIIQANDEIDRDSPICLFQKKIDSTYAPVEEIRSEHQGVVISLEAPANTHLSSGTTLLRIKVPCTHAVQYHGMCTFCGQDMSISDYRGSQANKAHLRILHGVPYLMVSEDVARDIQSKTKERLIKEKKLSLVLDLDQTLIHASVDERLKEREMPSDVFSFDLIHPYTKMPQTYFIKMRPNLLEFLSTIKDLYELHIYTLGTREYVDAIMKVLDPNGQYFGSQVLSRDECPDLLYKTPKRLFPVDDSMVVVVDDRADVWQWNPALIKVRPYDYFRGAGDINAPQWLDKKRKRADAEESEDAEAKSSTSSAFVAQQKKKDEDGIVFQRLLSVLREIHQLYYSTPHPNIQTLLPLRRQSVLRDCHITFSHIIPMNMAANTHDIWLLAEFYGATCSESCTSSTTHLVTGSLETLKVREAMFYRAHIVTLSWLCDSIDEMKRMKESDYEWEGIAEKKREMHLKELKVTHSFHDSLDDMYRDLEEFENDEGEKEEEEKEDVSGLHLVNHRLRAEKELKGKMAPQFWRENAEMQSADASSLLDKGTAMEEDFGPGEPFRPSIRRWNARNMDENLMLNEVALSAEREEKQAEKRNSHDIGEDYIEEGDEAGKADLTDEYITDEGEGMEGHEGEGERADYDDEMPKQEDDDEDSDRERQRYQRDRHKRTEKVHRSSSKKTTSLNGTTIDKKKGLVDDQWSEELEAEFVKDLLS